MINTRPIAVLSVGEILIDFIGSQAEASLSETKDYHRYLGGSPANVAMNVSRLGLTSKMIATVGNDGLGHYIEQRLQENNVETKHLNKIEHKPTTVIFVSRTTGTPDFLALRGADSFITESQIPTDLLKETTVYHTSCFALSMQPARETILKKAKDAFKLGCQLSIDINYSEKIWSNKEEAIEAIKFYCGLQPWVKVSQDDMDRLFGEELSHLEIFKRLHEYGANLVCLTLGNKGAKLSISEGQIIEMPAVKINRIVDATGAGDAFWSGFLFAKLKNKTNQQSMDIAMQIAAIKLQNVGRIPNYSEVLTNLLNS